MTVERGRGNGFETPGFDGAKDVYSGCIALGYYRQIYSGHGLCRSWGFDYLLAQKS